MSGLCCSGVFFAPKWAQTPPPISDQTTKAKGCMYGISFVVVDVFRYKSPPLSHSAADLAWGDPVHPFLSSSSAAVFGLQPVERFQTH